MATTEARIGLLFGRRVTDKEGRDLGVVHDVRLRADGPVLPGFGPALRIEGLVVGKGSLATRLGLDRVDVTGPWPLNAIGKRAARRAHLIPWDTIETREAFLTTTRAVHELAKAYP
jgi:hypothetical protein